MFIEQSVSLPRSATRRWVDERVEVAIKQLMRADSERDQMPPVVALVETIYDQFVPTKAPHPAREGGVEFTIDTEEKQHINLGGGANVVRALSPFSSRLDVYTRIGMKDAGLLKPLFRELPKHVHTHLIIDPDNPTAKKTRFTIDGHVHATLNDNPGNPSYEVEEEMIKRVNAITTKPLKTNILISDYGRKSITPRIMESVQTIVDGSNRQDLIIIDPRPDELTWYKYNINNGLIKPNKEEAISFLRCIFGKTEANLENIIQKLQSKRLKDIISGAQEAAEKILERLSRLSGILITLDKSGAMYVPNTGGKPEYYSSIPVKVVNPSGAGDIVTATVAILHKTVGLPSAISSALHLASLSTEEQDTSTLTFNLIHSLKKRLRME